jgi:hypothetical protein
MLPPPRFRASSRLDGSQLIVDQGAHPSPCQVREAGRPRTSLGESMSVVLCHELCSLSYCRHCEARCPSRCRSSHRVGTHAVTNRRPMEASTLYSPTRPGSSEKRRKRDSEVAGCCFRHDCRGTLVNCFKVRDFLVALVDAKEQLGTRCPTWPATGQWDQANLDAACCKGCWAQLSKVAKRFKDRVALLVAAAAPTPSPSRGATTPRLSDIETSTCFFCRHQGPNKGSRSDPKDRTFAGGGLWVFDWATLVCPDRRTDLPPGATSEDPKLFAHDKCYHRECYLQAQTEHKNYMAKECKKNANAVAPPPISQNKRAGAAPNGPVHLVARRVASRRILLTHTPLAPRFRHCSHGRGRCNGHRHA